MDRWTRRAVLAGMGGAAAVTALACSGGKAEVPARPKRGREPAPARLPGSATLGAGTLFLPGENGAAPNVRFVDTPRWFEEQPGIYCPASRTAGSSLMLFTDGDNSALSRKIKHFSELPALLEQARRQGTDTVYLVDFYEGAPGDPPERYCWNKGAYVPREDMGGAKALRKGIDAVHAAGGRVLLYLEPFVINKGSEVGKRHGQEWSLRTEAGYPAQPYPDDWKLCPSNPALVDHLVGVAKRLVGELGADGLHLDSAGFQAGWKCVEAAHGHPPGQARVFDAGMVALVGALREAVTSQKPDAVLMCEGPTMAPLFAHVSASQDWGIHTLVKRWVWDCAGSTAVFSSGWSLDDVHQILALGHKMTLGDQFWLEPPAGASPTAYLRAALPDPVPDKKDERFRRFFAETYFRELQRWRNGALLAGVSVPNLDRACPRRNENVEDFQSHEGLKRALAAVRAAAVELEEAIGGHPGVKVAAADHVSKLLRARQALAPALRGATPRKLVTGRADAVAWHFTGGRGAGALTAVSVSNEAVDLRLDLPGGTWRDVASGDRVASSGGATSISLAPHSVRFLEAT